MKGIGNTVNGGWERTKHMINKSTNTGDHKGTAKLLKSEMRFVTQKGTMQHGTRT
jgi:hypothetical protein